MKVVFLMKKNKPKTSENSRLFKPWGEPCEGLVKIEQSQGDGVRDSALNGVATRPKDHHAKCVAANGSWRIWVYGRKPRLS